MAAPESADGVLLLDKPEGFSSTQALARAKRFLAARKAGHTGTLDPFATGLLPLVFGEATKFSRFLLDAEKTYLATLRLGFRTTTGDTEGDLTPGAPFEGDVLRIDEVLHKFTGVRDQVPPMHSAVRVGGKRLYDLAREGREVERAARRIEISALRRERLSGEELAVSVTCSKGTYVRTLAADIGDALGCGAFLTALRRTAVGPFRLEDALALDALAAMSPEAGRARLLPTDVLVAGLPRLDADAPDAVRFTQGQALAAPAARAGEEFAIFGPGPAFLGVARAEADGRLAPLRLMATGAGEAP